MITARTSEIAPKDRALRGIDGSRATLSKTLLVCAILFTALVVVIIFMALLGSEKLPTQASLCALFTFGKSSCGLTGDQDAILFDIRLPRILLGAAVGGSLASLICWESQTGLQ